MRPLPLALLFCACGGAGLHVVARDGCQTAEHDLLERTRAAASERLGGCAIDSTCHLERDPTNAEWATCLEDATLARDCAELELVIQRCER